VAQLLVVWPLDVMDESDDYFDRAIKWYFIYRFLWACLGFVVLIGLGIFAIFYFVYTELSLEYTMQQKYGATWQVEFEKYHGSLSHAHMQLVICAASILAIIAVLTWFCRQTFHRHKKHKHEHTAA
jgi:hypothetical protein